MRAEEQAEQEEPTLSRLLGQSYGNSFSAIGQRKFPEEAIESFSIFHLSSMKAKQVKSSQA